MNNFELDNQAKTLAATKTNYELAKELVQLRGILDKIKVDAFEAGYQARDDGEYPDMTYQENVDQAYSEWVDGKWEGQP